MKRCLIVYCLCRNLQNSFGPHKARKNLGLEAVKWKTVAKVGVAPVRLPTLVMRNLYPRRCPNPLRFLVFVAETADGPQHVARTKTHVALRKNVAQLLRRTTQSQLTEIGISAKYLVEMFPSPT